VTWKTTYGISQIVFARLVLPLEAEMLQDFIPSCFPSGQHRLGLHVRVRIVISVHSELYTFQVTSPQLDRFHNRQQFLLRGCVIKFWLGQFPRHESYWLILLQQNSTNAHK
jgi:hypothetical protein